MTHQSTPSEFLLARYAEDEADPLHRPVRASTNRWMREVEAHRRIVEEARVFGEVDGTDQTLSTKLVTRGAVTAYDRTLRALASVYADHPDYRAEWAL